VKAREPDLMTAHPSPAGGWTLRPALPSDVEPIAELRAVVLRDDLERLGRYDERRVRQRLRDGFLPQYTSVVLAGGPEHGAEAGAGEPAGCVTLRPADGGGLWLEHFYLAPRLQGRGLGSAVLRSLLQRTDADGVPVRMIVLQGSAAQRLYERHGFTVEAEDPIDVRLVRPPAGRAHSGR
jgi:GNAT superfamily N-acetyltransferase